MTCDCIEKVEKNLQEASGDPEAKLNVVYEFPNLNERIYIPYTYREKKKDGTFTKEKEGKLTIQNCPFCGKPQKYGDITKEINDK